MGKSKALSSSKKPSKEPSKQLVVSNPPISKQSKGKEKNKGEIKILFVRDDAKGRHYGFSSLDFIRYGIAPSSVSRADGDLEKDSPPSSPRGYEDNIFTRPKPYDFGAPLRFDHDKGKKLHNALMNMLKKPMPLLFPYLEDLDDLKVLGEVKSLVGNYGLRLIFREDPGYYSNLTMEFISSFTIVVKLDEVKETEMVKT